MIFDHEKTSIHHELGLASSGKSPLGTIHSDRSTPLQEHLNTNLTMSALENTNMPNLKLVAKGKVRDIYALPDEADSDKLLFVATDRISAFDIIMDNVSLAVPIQLISKLTR